MPATDAAHAERATREPALVRLEAQVREELGVAPHWAASTLAEAIRERHGDAIAAVLFYGSCLRKDTHEGVLDFYVLVDSYWDLERSRFSSAANALLPPNVYYLEADSPQGVLRTKYAVISCRDFEFCASPSCTHPYIWARFAQPARCVYARDDETKDHVVRCVAQAVRTLVRRLGVFLPARAGEQRYSMAALWQEAFRRTYGAELRSESEATVRGLYEAQRERYDRAGALALMSLAEEGFLTHVELLGNSAHLQMPPSRLRGERLRWRALWPVAKGLAVLRLFKTAATFGDWLPYALWKLERHTGVHIEPTERQRRHPLIFGWPVILRILAGKKLR